MMMNMYNRGSEYTKALFINRYRTYYRKEYKTVCRFKHFSYDDLITLAKPEDERADFISGFSRILFVADLLGIEVGADCNYVYDYLNQYGHLLHSKEKNFFDKATGDSYFESLDEIKAKYDAKQLYSLDSKASKFLENVMKWLGYWPEYVDWCDENERGPIERIALTHSIYKHTFPKQEITKEELIAYSTLLHCASAMACNQDWLEESLRVLLYGAASTDFYESFPAKFRPENV